MYVISDLHWRVDTPSWRKEPDYSSVLRGQFGWLLSQGEPVLVAGDWFPLAVQNVAGTIEYMRVTARAGDVMTVVRGQENTAALDFDAGDLVFLPMTVAALNALGVVNEVTISVDDATVTA